MHMPPYQMRMQLSMMKMRLLYDVNFPCRDAQFIHDDVNAPLWICHNANAFFLLDANVIYPIFFYLPDFVGFPFFRFQSSLFNLSSF